MNVIIPVFRLLNYRKNTWIHLNCALWSNEVYETRDGGLVNIPQICKRAQDTVSHIISLTLTFYLYYILCT